MSTKRRRRRPKARFLFAALIISVAILAFAAGAHIFLKAVYVPAILMYHSVGEEVDTPDGYGGKLNVTTEAFERQMGFLKAHNYNVIPLHEMAGRIKRKEKIPHKTVSITFDDGLKDNFTNAFPILKKYGLTATIFVIVDFIGGRDFLNWEEIREMQENGISIGSHTISHRWLPSLDEGELKKELFESKAILERVTGRKIYTLSYPLGGHNDEVKKAAKEAGYVCAVATNPGRESRRDDIYALKRLRISMSSSNMFVFWVETSGYYTFIKETRDDD